MSKFLPKITKILDFLLLLMILGMIGDQVKFVIGCLIIFMILIGVMIINIFRNLIT